jgi:hypothetical protein
MTLGESPEQRVCQGIFTEVGEDLFVNLKSSEVGWIQMLALLLRHEVDCHLRELAMASSEKASIGVAS